ncbi:SPOR domain-containing protein [Psychromonas sp.]|uniref:SPOR domain-containing protein n=1 Tax=Psychromonas sp. TaxID=1884585 RepID=UPI003566E60F
MASQFKNRLVGVTILVACVVIFLPTIIDGKKNSYEDEFIATPIRPELKNHTLANNRRDPLANSTVPVEEAATAQTAAANDDWEIEEVANTVTLSKKPAKFAETIEKKQFPDRAWTIQLGAFQNADNINALLKQLHTAGFQAHTVPAEVTDGILTRVFVGPDVSEKRLKEQLPRLKKLTHLEGQIVSFKATNP